LIVQCQRAFGRIDRDDLASPGRAIDAAFVRYVLEADLPLQIANRSIDISACFAPDGERSIWFRRGVRARKQEHGGVREIHSRIADHANPVLRVTIENVAGHVGMRGLLNGQAVAAVPADRVADDAGRGGAQHLDAIPSIVLDDIRTWNLVVRADDTDVHRRTTEYENAVLLIPFDRVVDDSSKTVVRDLEPADRGVPDGVPVDRARSASVDRDAKRAAGHRETLDCHLAAEYLDGGAACVRCIDRRLSLTIESDAQNLRRYQQVLTTRPLHQDDVTRFQATEDWPDRGSPIAVDIHCCGTEVGHGGQG
jgi:hypothetical protein